MVVNFEQLQPLLQKENDTVYLINFWATWCAPCLNEIPYFEQLGEKYRDKKMKIVMVSLDFPDQLQTRLIPFIEKEKMKNEVILLDDPRSNRWIPLVDQEWTGAIPATLIYGNGFRKFYRKEFSFGELEEIILPLLTDSHYKNQ
jgi:thiol-disulfide isomerase/thioredoxin